MTEEQKQALIDLCNEVIDTYEHCGDVVSDEYEVYQIALAALTTSPGLVLRPFGEDSQNTFIKCENNHPLAMKLFTRPAPAAELAALVPGIMETPSAKITYSRGVADGWNDCRAAILHNIEEKSK